MSLDQLTSTATHLSESNTTLPAPRQTRSWAWLLPVGLILGFLLIFALLFGSRLLPATKVTTSPVLTLRVSADSDAEANQKPSAPESSTKMSKGQMLFQASGWVEPDPYVTYVPALINGIVHTVHVLEGQSVKKGDLLATLIDDDAKLQLQEAEIKTKTLEARISAHCVGSDIAQAEINAAHKKIDALKALSDDAIDNLTRLEKLPNEAIPEQQVVQARLAKIRRGALVAEAEAVIPRLNARIKQIALERVAMTSNLAELEIKRDTAQLAMDRTRIVSPMDGIVLKLHAAPGKKRMLNMDDADSAVIVSLYNPEKLQARIDVPLTEAAGITVGQIVELTSDILPDTVFQGHVTRITGEADLQRNTLQAKVEILKPDPRLRPEMLVRGKFFSSGSDTMTKQTSENASNRFALYIPEKAIVDGSSVWVVSNNHTTERRVIKLSNESRDGHRRVLEGVRSGEQIILPPYDDIEEGGKVVW